MSLKLRPPSPYYAAQHEHDRNRALEAADAENHKRGRDLDVGKGVRLVLTDENGGRWWLTVDTAGALVVTAAP